MNSSTIWCGKPKGKGCCSVHGSLKPAALNKSEQHPFHNKTFKRHLDILAGTYEFDPVVPEHHRQWHKEQSRRYIDDLVRCYFS